VRVYLDVCCLNRPFDDQSQARIRVEAEAVKAVAQRVDAGTDQWISSQAVEWEVRRTADPDRLSRLQSLLSEADETLELSGEILARAARLQRIGLGALDASHISFAVAGRCDVFLTTDDRLLRKAQSLGPECPLTLRNPAAWIMEVTTE
jgi:predicted nucleic acid-binding protein